MAALSRWSGSGGGRRAWALIAALGLVLQAAMPLIGPPTSVTRVHGLGFRVPPVTTDLPAAAAVPPPHDHHAAADPSKPPMPSHDGAGHTDCPICLLLLLHGSFVAPGAIAIPLAIMWVARGSSRPLEPPPTPSRWERPQARSPPAPA